MASRGSPPRASRVSTYPGRRRHDGTVDRSSRTRGRHGIPRARNSSICLRGLRRRGYSPFKRMPPRGRGMRSPSPQPRSYSVRAPICCSRNLCKWAGVVDRALVRHPTRVHRHRTVMGVKRRCWPLRMLRNRCLCILLGCLSREGHRRRSFHGRCTCWRIRRPISWRLGSWMAEGVEWEWEWERGCSCRSHLDYERQRLDDEPTRATFDFGRTTAPFSSSCTRMGVPSSCHGDLSDPVQGKTLIFCGTTCCSYRLHRDYTLWLRFVTPSIGITSAW